MNDMAGSGLDSFHVCGICLKKSSYVCPRCGINYCSLNCYRSPKHSTCSESFYRECCMNAMRNSFVDADTRTKMVEILRRQSPAEGNAEGQTTVDQSSSDEEEEGEGEEEGEECEGQSTLRKRFSDLELESKDVQADEIWSRLTLKEQREFCRLLDSGGIINYLPVWTPWWSSSNKAKIKECGSEVAHANLPIKLPLSKIYPSGNRPHQSVAFALADVLLGYIVVCRFYNGDHFDLMHEACERLCLVVSSFGETHTQLKTQKLSVSKLQRTVILTPKRPTAAPIYENLSQVIASVQTKLAELRLPCDPQFVVLLLEDLNAILSSADSICRGLAEIHRLLLAVRADRNPADASNAHDELRKVIQKVVFLRACTDPNDSSALAWQASAYPVLRHQASAELCVQLTLLSDGKDQSAAAARPISAAAGPNWRQMIRTKSEQTVPLDPNKPLITPCFESH
ncbi:unnamed protein product [Calicophoron daubneyi]